MTDTEALIVSLNPAIAPLLQSLAADCVSNEPADQIYFCLARLRILMRGVVLMLESESSDVRATARELIDSLSNFTLSAEAAEDFLDSDEPV